MQKLYLSIPTNPTYMGRNDLFLDSGIIYGSIDRSDETWHDPCKDHFTKFPRNKNNYFSVKRIVDIEIGNVGRNRKRSGFIKSDRILRSIVQTAQAWFNNKEVRDIDYMNSKKELYDALYKIIHKLLLERRIDQNPKDRDAHLLTNAFMWDSENRSLHNPHFITIDYTDIKKNENDLISEATIV